MVFPELAVTGYTCGDLFRDATLIQAAERGLSQLMEETGKLDLLCVVGVPVAFRGGLYNCAAVFLRGKLLGLPAKTHIPNYAEFYEARHFTPAPEKAETVLYCGQRAPMGGNLLFSCENVTGLTVGVEICEDLWVAGPPSTRLAQCGATVLLNPSCSDETIGKAEYRRELVKSHSARLLALTPMRTAALGNPPRTWCFPDTGS
ncbi:MAG: nitrilase-related carbon-nitrogen hydrolase [Eubacteriales bacterium]